MGYRCGVFWKMTDEQRKQLKDYASGLMVLSEAAADIFKKVKEINDKILETHREIDKQLDG